MLKIFKKSQFQEEEKSAILAAVKNAEKISGVEIVTVVTKQSGDYRSLTMAFNIALAMTASLAIYLFSPIKSFFDLWLIQLVVFLCSELLFAVTNLEFCLVPSKAKTIASTRNAHHQFAQKVSSQIKNKKAVMFFISLNERHAQLISNISEVGGLDSVRANFSKNIQSGKIAAGLIEAIDEAGKALAKRNFAKKTSNHLKDEMEVN